MRSPFSPLLGVSRAPNRRHQADSSLNAVAAAVCKLRFAFSTLIEATMRKRCSTLKLSSKTLNINDEHATCRGRSTPPTAPSRCTRADRARQRRPQRRVVFNQQNERRLSSNAHRSRAAYARAEMRNLRPRAWRTLIIDDEWLGSRSPPPPSPPPSPLPLVTEARRAL